MKKHGSVQSLSHVWLFVTPWTAARQASLFTISQSLPKFMSLASVMPSSHLILWHPLLLLPSIFPSIRDFSNKSAVHIRWLKHWSFNVSISPSNEYSRLISLKIDWFDLLNIPLSSVQFSHSVVSDSLRPMNRNTPGCPVHHQLTEPTQTHVHWVSDAIQPSHPLSSPSPPVFNLSQNQNHFQWVSSSH